MRPVRPLLVGHFWPAQLWLPGRDLATDSRAPLRCALLERSLPARELRAAATRPSRPLRVSVKTVGWDRERCHRPPRSRDLLAEVRGPIPPRNMDRGPIRSGPRDASLALPRTGSLARAGEGARPLPPNRSSSCRKERSARRPNQGTPVRGDARSLLSSRLPREH
jgi:hypothetical protein